jgi:DNA-binding NtrC family response regulator
MSIRLNPDVLEQIMEQNNNNFSAVARKIGVERSTLWRIVGKKGSAGNDFIQKFKVAFPEISLDDAFFMEK